LICRPESSAVFARSQGRAAIKSFVVERDNPGLKLDRLEHKLGTVHERRGDWQLAESRYVEALRLGADQAVVEADRSRVAWRRGDIDGARALAAINACIEQELAGYPAALFGDGEPLAG